MPHPPSPLDPQTLHRTGADRLLTMLRSRFVCDVEEVDLDGARIQILRVADPDSLIENTDPALFTSSDRFPYWADLWNAGVALARWIRRSGMLKGKRVLELGCGAGLVGIAAAQCGAKVTMTDHAEEALLFAEYNAVRNCPAAAIELRYLDWRSPGTVGTYDVVLGADILYERSDFEALLSLFATVAAAGGTILLADPDRKMGNEFLDLARGRGFEVETTSLNVERRGRTSRVICSRLLSAPVSDPLR